MAARPKGPNGGLLSRKRTADLLRELRRLEKRSRMLKVRIDAATRMERKVGEPRLRRNR